MTMFRQIIREARRQRADANAAARRAHPKIHEAALRLLMDGLPFDEINFESPVIQLARRRRDALFLMEADEMSLAELPLSLAFIEWCRRAVQDQFGCITSEEIRYLATRVFPPLDPAHPPAWPEELPRTIEAMAAVWRRPLFEPLRPGWFVRGERPGLSETWHYSAEERAVLLAAQTHLTKRAADPEAEADTAPEGVPIVPVVDGFNGSDR